MIKTFPIGYIVHGISMLQKKYIVMQIKLLTKITISNYLANVTNVLQILEGNYLPSTYKQVKKVM